MNVTDTKYANEREIKKPFLYWMFFWCSGIATLFVWNAVVSQTDYIKSRYDESVDKVFPTYYFLGGLIAFLLYFRMLGSMSFKNKITIIPSILVAISIAIYFFGEYAPKNSTKFGILMALCFCDGFFSAIIKMTLISYSFLFGPREIAYCSSGGALIAIFINLISLANELSFKLGDYHIKGLLYLIFQILTLSFLLVIFGAYCLRQKEDLKRLGPHSSGRLAEGLINQEEQNNSNRKPSLLSTLAIIRPYFFNMVFTYTVTLSIFPGMCLDLGLNWSSPAASQIILLTFNTFDCLGKFLYSIKGLSDNYIPHLCCLGRGLFVVFVILAFGTYGQTSLQNNPYITISFTAVFALSNGYLTAAMFTLSAMRCPPCHKDNAGFLMTLALTLGLFYGALCTTFSTAKLN